MKKLPYSLESEKAILWCIIFDNSILSKTDAKEQDFYDDRNKLIFRIFKTLKENNKDIDVSILRDFIYAKKLESKIWGYLYLTELDEACSHSTFWQTYNDEIIQSSQERQIILKWKKLQELWYEWKIDEALSEIEFDFEIKKNKWADIIELTNSFTDFVDNIKKNWWLWYKWPFPILDKYIWGIIKAKVYTIVAYSNVWKSNFSYSYVVDALQKWKKVLFYSLEVQKDLLFMQILKAYYWINQNELLKDDFVYDMEDFKNLIVYDDVYELEEIKNITRTQKPDLIFIDFIQNVKTKWNWEYEQMTTIAQELQRFAIMNNITIFSISQANNESRFKNANKIQPKGSWAIFASSDVILALTRDWQNLNLNILKNKFWPADKNFLVVPDFTKIQFKISNEVQEKEIKTNFNL